MATVKKLMESLPRMTWSGGPPPLIVMAGLPASGKSYTAHLLAAHLGLTHISADWVRMNITGGRPRYSNREGLRVRRSAIELSSALLSGGSGVVMDAISLTKQRRTPYLRAAPGRTAVIWCAVDEETATELLAMRAAGGALYDFSRADAAERARCAAMLIEPPADNEADLVFRLNPRQLDELLEALCTELGVPSCATHPPMMAPPGDQPTAEQPAA